jgi:hypothetical protein
MGIIFFIVVPGGDDFTTDYKQYEALEKIVDS